jgi:hypothetical protein
MLGQHSSHRRGRPAFRLKTVGLFYGLSDIGGRTIRKRVRGTFRGSYQSIAPAARSICLAPLANIIDGKRVLPRYTSLELSTPHRANPSPAHRGFDAL